MHGLTQLGKQLFYRGTEDPFWAKIRDRLNVIIENEEKFMKALEKGIIRVPDL